MRERKQIRLSDYDYSQTGFYFITICTKNKQKILSTITGGDPHATPNVELTLLGKEIVKTVNFIENHNPDVLIDKYIIMPNHIHAIIILGGDGTPPLHKIIGQLKSFTTKRYNDINKTKNQILWQRSYYDHVIRNDREYREVWNYIDINPLKWEDDKYYI